MACDSSHLLFGQALSHFWAYINRKTYAASFRLPALAHVFVQDTEWFITQAHAWTFSFLNFSCFGLQVGWHISDLNRGHHSICVLMDVEKQISGTLKCKCVPGNLNLFPCVWAFIYISSFFFFGYLEKRTWALGVLCDCYCAQAAEGSPHHSQAGRCLLGHLFSRYRYNLRFFFRLPSGHGVVGGWVHKVRLAVPNHCANVTDSRDGFELTFAWPDLMPSFRTSKIFFLYWRIYSCTVCIPSS